MFQSKKTAGLSNKKKSLSEKALLFVGYVLISWISFAIDLMWRFVFLIIMLTILHLLVSLVFKDRNAQNDEENSKLSKTVKRKAFIVYMVYLSLIIIYPIFQERYLIPHDQKFGGFISIVGNCFLTIGFLIVSPKYPQNMTHV